MTDAVAAELLAYNAYARRPRQSRLQEEDWRSYKKGWEVRVVLATEEEIDRASRLLVKAGFKPGHPFRKANQWVVPVYGRKALAYFGFRT